MARFSPGGSASARSTWKSQVLPTRQAAWLLPCSTAVRPGSFSTERPGRRVMPKATKVARVSSGGSAKKASSVGLAPGQPPSTASKPAVPPARFPPPPPPSPPLPPPPLPPPPLPPPPALPLLGDGRVAVGQRLGGLAHDVGHRGGRAFVVLVVFRHDEALGALRQGHLDLLPVADSDRRGVDDRRRAVPAAAAASSATGVAIARFLQCQRGIGVAVREVPGIGPDEHLPATGSTGGERKRGTQHKDRKRSSQQLSRGLRSHCLLLSKGMRRGSDPLSALERVRRPPPYR